jgi:hypothetical protein
VHKYFSPYESPCEAYVAFMNVLNDLSLRLGRGAGPRLAVDNPAELLPAPRRAAGRAGRRAARA